MSLFLKILAICGLVLTLLPSIFVFAGKLELSAHYNLMIIGMVLWFVGITLSKKKYPNR